MADYKLSELTAITDLADTDLLHIRNNSGVDKKITAANLKAPIAADIVAALATARADNVKTWPGIIAGKFANGWAVKVAKSVSNYHAPPYWLAGGFSREVLTMTGVPTVGSFQFSLKRDTNSYTYLFGRSDTDARRYSTLDFTNDTKYNTASTTRSFQTSRAFSKPDGSEIFIPAPDTGDTYLKVLKSTDYGHTWTLLDTDLANPSLGFASMFAYSSALSRYFMFSGTTSWKGLYSSTDGVTWTEQRDYDSYDYSYATIFYDGTIGVVYGMNATFTTFVDTFDGTTWTTAVGGEVESSAIRAHTFGVSVVKFHDELWVMSAISLTSVDTDAPSVAYRYNGTDWDTPVELPQRLSCSYLSTESMSKGNNEAIFMASVNFEGVGYIVTDISMEGVAKGRINFGESQQWATYTVNTTDWQIGVNLEWISVLVESASDYYLFAVYLGDLLQ